jgi:hypothetical protein
MNSIDDKHGETHTSHGETEGSTVVHHCVECHAEAPKTTTNYTLISARFGWRLRVEQRDGRRHTIWRCPGCWQRFKHRSGQLSL